MRIYTEEHGIIGDLRGKKLRVVDGVMEIRLKGNNWVECYPSTTTIIGMLDKPALVQWAANMVCEYIRGECPWDTWEDDLSEGYYTVTENDLKDARFNFRSVSKDALDVGSEVHNAIEDYLLGKKVQPPTSLGALNGFNAFLSWEKEHGLIVIETEQRLLGKRWQGTCDLVCYLDGKKYVIDFKTSKKPKPKDGYPEWTYQLACYRSAIPECKGMGVLRLDKETGEPDWYDLSGKYEWGLDMFNLLTDLFYKQQEKE